MESPHSDDQPDPEPEQPSVFPTEEKETPPPKAGKQPLSRGRKIFRFLLGFLIVLALGALLVIQLLYVPLRERSFRQDADFQTMQARITELASEANQVANSQDSTQQQIADLQAGQEVLRAELDQANLHNALLKARLDVARAQFFLELENPTNARAALSSTDKTLSTIGGYLNEDGQQILEDQQERLKLILSEINTDAFAARSDLDVLANNLLEIENEYFANPVDQLERVTPTATP